MIDLSQNDCIIIAKRSLNISFDHLRKSFRKTEQNYRFRFISHDVFVNNLDLNFQKTISRFLNVLKNQEIVFNLHSKIENFFVIFVVKYFSSFTKNQKNTITH